MSRRGPSLMPGGALESFQRIQKILEAIAAKASNEPCVAYLGTGGSGHYVKMVHNGIEYGILQLIAESYDLMKRGLGFTNQQLADQYAEWNRGALNSYLIEITHDIFNKKDERTSKKLIDVIKDVAEQNGTGLWTVENAMELQVPVPIMDAAVWMRDLSALVQERSELNSKYPFDVPSAALKDVSEFLHDLERALLAGIIMVYAQGMAVLKIASEKYHYWLNLETIARIWRGGCIIRSELLEDICVAFQNKSDLSNLLLDENISNKINRCQGSLRKVVSQITELGLPIPGFMAALAYFDAFRSGWLPINLIQAQRDYFGSHGFERIDVSGKFHAEWKDQ